MTLESRPGAPLAYPGNLLPGSAPFASLPAAEGTAALTLSDPIIAATGVETFGGTAALTAGALTLAATGGEAFSSTAAISLEPLSLASAGVWWLTVAAGKTSATASGTKRLASKRPLTDDARRKTTATDNGKRLTDD